MSLYRYFALAALCFSGSSQTHAQVASIALRAILLPACEAGTVDSGGAIGFGILDFGQYASLDNVITATSQPGAGSIRVKCAAGQPYSIRLDGGLHGNVSSRRMANVSNASSTLTYNLYSDRPGGTVWDNVQGVRATGDGRDQWYPIHGLVPAQAPPAPGTYRDTVNVTIGW